MHLPFNNSFDSSASQIDAAIKCGPLNFRISCFDKAFSRQVEALYRSFPKSKNEEFIDFHVSIRPANTLFRRHVAKQANFFLDNHQPFKPLPHNQGYAMLEWGMNWCIATHCHQYLIIHAAVISKDGVTVMLPAPPGSGKSTLTALLTYSGWRLLSDELALIRLSDLKIDALARPINLKNQSIDIIKRTFPHVVHSDIVKDTHKGTVCLFEPPEESVRRANEPATLTHVIFPRYNAESTITYTELSRDQLFFSLIENSFNYNIQGERGFNTLVDITQQVDAANFTYSDNDCAIEFFNQLVNDYDAS